MRTVLALAVIAVFVAVPATPALAAPAATPAETWVANGTVWSAVPAGPVTYLGGDFTELSPATGNAIALATADGTRDTSFPTVSGLVRAVAARPGGGWFLGGSFSAIGGKARGGLAATTAADAVSGWNPKAVGGAVLTMALSPDASILYVGGTFTSIGSSARDGLAAFTTADLKLTSWAPTPVTGGSVTALAVGPNGTVYVGGSFTGVAGAGRSHIAAVAPDGSLTSWNPGASDTVATLAADATDVYAGGDFTTLAHTGQNFVGAIDGSTGSAAGWTGTGADAPVNALALSGSTLFVGGAFATVDGQARARLGAVSTADGHATAFAADADGSVGVLSVSADGSHLVAGGNFLSVGGVGARRLASIDTSTGAVDPSFTPDPNDAPRAIARSADDAEALIGGAFTGAGGVLRSHIGAIDVSTGQATAWDPGADGTVYAIAVDPSGTVVYAGGAFTHVGGAGEQKLAAIDASTGDVVTAFHVGASNRVRSLAAAGDLLYVGGEFTKLGGQPRPYLGAVRISTDSVDGTWLPAADGLVRSILPLGGRIYVGGDFTHVGGSALDHVAAVDPTSGAAIAAFATQSPKYRTFELSTDGTNVFAAMGGPGGRLRAYQPNGSAVWEMTADGDVQACTYLNGLVIIGGHFASLGGAKRSQIGAADATTGSLDGWGPSTNGSIWSLAADTNGVVVGGSFTRVAGLVRAGFMRFPAS
ncbi:MAG: hypothetical protein ACJ76A_08230 [Actinomycetota bacterium]